MIRAVAIMIVCGCTLAWPARACLAETPEETFASLFGDEAKKAAASPKDAAAFAAKLLAAAKKAADAKDFQILLLDKAYDFAMKDPSGYPTAIEAMKMQIALVAPEKKADVQARLMKACETRLQRATASEKPAAAEALAVELITAGDAQYKDGNAGEAAITYRRASQVAGDGCPSSPLAKSKLEQAMAMEAADKSIAALETQLKNRPSPAVARSLMLAWLVQKDDPAKAGAVAAQAEAEETFKTYLPLAAKDAKEVAQDVCMELAQWYKKLADQAPTTLAKGMMLRRALTYCRRFRSLHTAKDAAAVAADTLYATLRTDLAKATGRTLDAWPYVADLGIKADDATIKAMKSGVEYLLAAQKENGAWEAYDTYYAGPTCMAILALRAHGVPTSDPRIVKALDWLAGEKLTKTYELSCRANVWLMADRDMPRSKYHKLLEQDVSRLAASSADGSFGYDSLGDHKSRGCNSNSEFAVWGLAAGVRGGIDVPAAVWAPIAKHWTGAQKEDGGWNYQGNDKTKINMTASGIASLAIAMSQQRRTKAETVKAAEIKKGVDWLAKHNAEPGDDQPFYYLFVIARAGAAAETATIGDIDWYKNGAAWLLKRQGRNGSWEFWGHPVTHTSFALLFLSAGRPPGDED